MFLFCARDVKNIEAQKLARYATVWPTRERRPLYNLQLWLFFSSDKQKFLDVLSIGTAEYEPLTVVAIGKAAKTEEFAPQKFFYLVSGSKYRPSRPLPS